MAGSTGLGLRVAPGSGLVFLPGQGPYGLELPHFFGRILAYGEHFALVRREHPAPAEFVLGDGLAELQLEAV